MKRSSQWYLLLSLLILFNSCENNNKVKTKGIVSTPDSTGSTAISDSLPTLDSIIVLSNVSTSEYIGTKLNSSLAKKVLYKHFKDKGYLIEDNLHGKINGKDSKKMCVRFDSIYFTNINHNNFPDAIIDYWLTPPGASGNCWQPHKAVIMDTDKGYHISNEDFIPSNYVIDSVTTVECQITLYGYDYDCGNHKALKHIRLSIN